MNKKATYHCEGSGKETKSVHDMLGDTFVGDASNVFTYVLPTCHQNGGYHEYGHGPFVMELEDSVVDVAFWWLEWF